jgi:antitoxin component YwqK of YwqJK toxin-antitoxin module
VNGKKEGKWIEYDEKGNIRKTTYYKDDIEKK